MLKISTNNQQN